MRIGIGLGLLAGCAQAPLTDGTADDTEPLGPQGEVPFVAPDEPGPFKTGTESIEFTDERGKSLKLQVWYPAWIDEGDEPDPYEEITLALNAYEYAKPDKRNAPYPIVAFSHGLGGVRYQSASITEHLASHGYVVVAPDHPGSVLFDLDFDEIGQVALERPDDIRFSVDHIVELSETDHKRLGGMVDIDPGYAMIGHSFGAFTTLAIAGGEADYAGMEAYCSANGGDGCGYISDVDASDLALHGSLDDRIVTAIPMSPGIWYAFGEDGSNLADSVPMLVLGGTSDNVLGYDSEIRPTYDHLGGPKALATLEGFGHYAAYSDMCTILPVFGDCADADTIDVAGGIRSTIGLTTAWLGVYFLEDDAYRPWLEDDWRANFPELSWEFEE